MRTLKHSTLAAGALMAIFAVDVIAQLGVASGVSNGSTSAMLLLNVLSSALLVYLATKTKWKEALPKPARIALLLLLCWGAIVLVRGALVASDYWSWRALLTNHIFIYLVPLAIAIGLSPVWLSRVLTAMMLLVLPIGVALMPLSLAFELELFQRAVMPLYMLLLLTPFLRPRWWLILLALAVASIWVEPNYRANVMRLAMAAVLMVVYALRFSLRPKLLNMAAILALIAPIVVLGLGVSGAYNVFRDDIRVENGLTVIKDGRLRDSELTADTRTFLYDEVFTSMVRRNSSFLIGQGAGTGYESSFFRQSLLGTEGRFASEVGFLNVLMYSGIVGVAFYGVMLLLAAFYSFNRSNNDACKLIGLFLLFKWILFFIEDIPKMDLNMFVTWTMIGICLSGNIRRMTNAEIAELLKSRRLFARRWSRSNPLRGRA